MGTREPNRLVEVIERLPVQHEKTTRCSGSPQCVTQDLRIAQLTGLADKTVRGADVLGGTGGDLAMKPTGTAKKVGTSLVSTDPLNGGTPYRHTRIVGAGQ
ncbi:hypothetical protein GCM10023113_28430 [Cellulomonas oligotrophica]|uniref:Uncharacterized protein n=1 Tax=Cellulomonas oligotrophica TaxID=931536 RepID=A0ABQ4D6X2_9CELL|nr:hypothetical protein Col01nite_06300 [Cellulomonas oligotrophica]